MPTQRETVRDTHQAEDAELRYTVASKHSLTEGSIFRRQEERTSIHGSAPGDSHGRLKAASPQGDCCRRA